MAVSDAVPLFRRGTILPGKKFEMLLAIHVRKHWVLGRYKMRFGILLDCCSKHLDVILKNKVFLVLYLGGMIRESDKELLPTPEGVKCFLHRVL